MARYKHIDTSPRFIAVDLQKQLLPGTIEHALNYLLDHQIDLTGLDARFCNDAAGAAAYPPAMLLKIILFAYSQGIISSRNIERACREHITFIALSGDTAPHFTTIANFISTLGEEIAHIFSQVLFICDQQGLIGREMFAIDGVKLPSNASKARSGTRADFERQTGKLETAAKVMLERHREADRRALEPDLQAKETQRITRLQTDAGYHSEANLKELASMKIEALIADNNMRSRDERFAEQGKYKALPDTLYDKGGKPKQAARYRPRDFDYDPHAGTCVCPAGKPLYGNGSGCTINGYAAVKFQGAQRDCVPCTHRDRCLLTPQKTKTRQVSFLHGKVAQESYTDKMKRRSTAPQDGHAMADASPRWSRYSATCATTSSSIVSPSEGESRSMCNGSCIAWCTTSKN